MSKGTWSLLKELRDRGYIPSHYRDRVDAALEFRPEGFYCPECDEPILLEHLPCTCCGYGDDPPPSC